MTDENSTKVGVIGVGSMGQHHARIYESLPRTDLVGVFDADDERAAEIADEYDTRSMSMEHIFEKVGAASIAVPTQYHYDIARDCLEHDIDVLVEKPFVNSVAKGEELVQLADDHDKILQVGHVERFNPAIRGLEDILEEHEIIALNAERLGPPTDREIDDSAVLDLMVHDIDIVLSIVDAAPTSITSAGVRDNQHATATLSFNNDVIAELTASRLTQKKVRKLDVITEECLIRVDYIERSIEIHRASTPEYIRENEDVRYRHESIVERPMVDSTEPLRNELAMFLASVRKREAPVVDGEDGIRALQVANRIDQAGAADAGRVNLQTISEVSLD